MLLEIGLRAQALNQEFILSTVPVVDTLQVSVTHDGRTHILSLDEDFTDSDSRNSVFLTEYQPPVDALIDVTYDAR